MFSPPEVISRCLIASFIPPSHVVSRRRSVCLTSTIFCVKVIPAGMLLRGLGASGDVARAFWSGLGLEALVSIYVWRITLIGDSTGTLG